MAEKTHTEWILDQLHELNPKALTFDGFDDCIIGVGCQYSKDPVLVYDEQKMVEHLVWTEGWDFEDAWDFLCFNTFNAWMGEGTPIVLKSINDW